MDRIEVKFAPDEIDASTGEFAGYGAVFGNIDSHGDVIVPGAFTETLTEWQGKGRWPAMKLMHGTALRPFTGDDLPIGRWTEMREDAEGLFVKGRLSALDTDHGRRIHALMKDGALGGLSIGYKAKRFSRGPGGNGPKRRLESVWLGEVSIVDEPSNDRTRIASIKSADDITTIREFEEFLREVGKFSHAQAKAIASHGFKAAPRDEDEAGELAAILRRNIETLVPKGN